MQLAALDLREHAARVLDVQRAAYLVEARLIGDDRIPTLHETVDDLLATQLDWLAAFDDGVLIGAIAWSVDGDALEIDRLFVDPSASRRGVGRMLVSAAIAAAGPLPVLVSTGRDNPPAVALYESLGFERTVDIEVIDGLWITQLRRAPAAGCPAHDRVTGRPR